MTDAVADAPITKDEEEQIDKEQIDKDLKDKELKSKEAEPEPKDTKETAQTPKQRSVSFNRDVHVKRFGKPREVRASSIKDPAPILRKEPFTHLSEKELLDEAAKVIAQADSVSCTADHPPEKFFSLPYRKKNKPEPEKSTGRRKSADLGEPDKKLLGRSTSDVGTPKKRGKERTSLSTLFRRANKSASPDRSEVGTEKSTVILTPNPGVIVRRSKSDVTDLKSKPNLNTQPKPVRKRSGSESEEFLKSLRNKKTQLSPIIEASPREDYFKKSPLKPKKDLTPKNSNSSVREDSKHSEQSESRKVNPIEKPPRFKTPEKQSNDPKPPTRIKRSKAVNDLSDDKSKQPEISETPKRKTEIKKTLLVDEIDKVREKDINPNDLKERIKESINKLQNNIYGKKEMIHSSQQPPDKPPLTKGHTVDHIVKILKEDQLFPPPKTHLIAPHMGSNKNQPFSYTRPSVSPDPNLYIRSSSPERPLTPVNKMQPDKSVVYAQVICNQGEKGRNGVTKQTIHKTYSPATERYGNNSDEDEGYEDRNANKYSTRMKYDYDFVKDDGAYKKDYRAVDSPIVARFREYKPAKFEEFEPTYANEFPEKVSHDFVDTAFRGRADGMDTKRRNSIEPETAKMGRTDLNDLSHRRQLLESRINARRIGDRIPDTPIVKYLPDNDPILEAENRMKATEKFVNETARYYHHTLERDGFVENSISDTYSKIDSENNKVNYNNESRTFEKVNHEVFDRTDGARYYHSKDRKVFPPEPEYEPPSLESNVSIEKKYKSKSRFTSSNDALHTGQKYSKTRDERFGKRKGHYASNPEIVHEREEIYENAKYDPKYADTYHNSLRRDKGYDRHYKDIVSPEERILRHGSGDYKYDLRSRFENDRSDNRLVDSGIENDFRKDSSGEINRTNKLIPYNSKIANRVDSDEENVNFIANERRHTEDSYPHEQIYANGDYHYRKPKYSPRERSIDDGSHYDLRIDRLEHSPVRKSDERVSAKPPKAAKKLSGLEKMKQLFSSSKKSKKDKEIQTKSRTRVLKSPEHLASEEQDFPRYRSSDEDTRRQNDDLHRRYKEYRGSSDERDSDHRSPKPSELESELKSRETSRVARSRTADPVDSPRLAERYSQRRRLATPSPTPSPTLRARPPSPRRVQASPPRRPEPAPQIPKTSAGNWFKSLDRLSRKKNKASKIEKESGITTEDESIITRKTWTTKTERSKPLASPAKNLRFFGDTDQDSDANISKHTIVTKSKSHPQKSLRKTTSTSQGIDEIDRSELSKKSYSLSNLRRESPKRTYRDDSPNLIGYRGESTKRVYNREGSPKRTVYNRDDSPKRTVYNREGSPKRTVYNRDDSPKITVYNRDDSPKRIVYNREGSPKRTVYNREVSPKRTVYNRDDSPKRIVYNREESPKRTAYNREEPPKRYNKRNLHNISEIHSNSETESQFEETHVRRLDVKPPIDRRSRSNSSSKNVMPPLKGSRTDLRRNGNNGSRSELREGSSGDLRASKERGSRGDLKLRRRTPGTQSGESSTEGESSHQSQRSVVFLHATTVGDIPDPGQVTRGRSRDDVSSVNSSNIQVKTVARSFSLLAPWRPRHYNEQYDVNYAQTARPNKRVHKQTSPKNDTIFGKSKSSSTKNLNAPGTLQKNRSMSQTTLNRKKATPSRLSSSNNTLYKKRSNGNSSSKENVNTMNVKSSTMSRRSDKDRDYKKSISTEVLTRDNGRSERERVSRSISMPKDNSKKAGWFKLTSKSKKPEQTSRVR